MRRLQKNGAFFFTVMPFKFLNLPETLIFAHNEPTK